MRMRFVRVLMVALCAVPAGLLAQDPVSSLVDRAPRFLVVAAPSPAPLDVERSPVLQKRIALDLRDVTIEEALESIGRRSGLTLAYSKALVPVDRRVRLRAKDVTVAAALSAVLMNTATDVLFSGGTQATLIRRAGQAIPPAFAGTVTGKVSELVSGQPVAGAKVEIVGGDISTTTRSDGLFRLNGVPEGRVRVRVTRLGFKAQEQSVDVGASATVSVDFVMSRVPTSLSEVVTTATGDQRRVELGHVIATIDADSLAREAPITSVTELINARVAGVQVTQNDGQVGGNSLIRIRGPNTLNGIDQQPIVFVDGVRYGTTKRSLSATQQAFTDGVAAVQPSSRLNDLNVNDIETVEIVKGAAASTLYGPDAANGVLVITTKRGRAGPARWRAYARGAVSDIPVAHFPDYTWAWATLANGTPSQSSCSLRLVATGSCKQDSITVVRNPLNDAQWTMFDRKPRWNSGVNVSGGKEELRYYFSGDMEEATGPITLPLAEATLIKEQRRVNNLPDELLEPNHFFKTNFRTNVFAALSDRGKLSFNAGYTQSATRTLSLAGQSDAYRLGATSDVPSDTSSTPYAVATSPGEQFASTSTEYVKRLTLSATGDWRAFSWLVARASAGVDHLSSTRKELIRAGESARVPTGRVSDLRTDRVDYSLTTDATATAQRGRISSRTTVGAQYHREVQDGFSALNFGLLPGGESFAQATGTLDGAQIFVELASFGGYLEQTAGLNGRFFLTGALRADGASTFGQGYDATLNPKISASWLASAEPFFPRLPGLDELRLRYAFGSSTIQPYPVMSGVSNFTSNVYIEGKSRLALGRSQVPNPGLRPERAQEHEFGFDATGLKGRIQTELTWYRRRTEDLLNSSAQAGSLTFTSATRWENIGLVTNDGFEASLTAQVLEKGPVNWDVTVQHSYYDNKLVELGDATGSVASGNRVGYPLGSAFSRPILSYQDANGNGILELAEVVLGDSVHVGRTIAPREQTLTNTFGLFNRRVRVSALIDRRSGHVIRNSTFSNQCAAGRCAAAVDPATPLEEQAKVVASSKGTTGSSVGAAFGMWEKGDITRFRELSLSLDVPARLIRWTRGRDATLTLQGRNLGVISRAYNRAPDSESVVSVSSSPVFPSGTDQIPQSRTFAVRLDFGF
jgi:TonB-dependent starch-binding outer membrane protein SusC